MKWLVPGLAIVYGVLVLGRAAVIVFPSLPDVIGRFRMSSGQPTSASAPPAAATPGSVPAATPSAGENTEWPHGVETEVKAKPDGLWTIAREFVAGPARIRFEAKGSWKYSPDSPCGPDGDMLSMISPGQTILKSAPVGSLIAKIGGSSAGQTDGTLYLIGSFAVIEIGADVKGPLYLTINDDPGGFMNNSESLKVKVQWKPVTVATPAAQH
jgi:PA-IL-like protein